MSNEEEFLFLKKAYKDTFKTDSGQIVLDDLTKRLKLLDNIYIPGNDAQTTAYLLGRRSVIVDITKILENK